MVNNFNLIKENLTFLNDKSFYFIQILKRKKENPEMKSYSRPIESFYVFSTDQLERLMPHIIEKCEQNRARAYIKMNCLDAESVMLESISVMTQEIRKRNWKSMSSVLNSACGICGKQDGNEKLYLIDLDGEFADKKEEVIEYVESLEPIKYNYTPLDYGLSPEVIKKVKMVIPTRNGVHLLSTGFNMEDFRKVYPKSVVDIHDDGITLLYFPKCCD